MRKLCFQMISHECLWAINIVHTFHMNTHVRGPPVVWPEGGVRCVACQTWWYFLWRSDPISKGLWRAASQTARLGLGQWQWHTEAVNFWHTAVTNCEEKVREICSGAISWDMEIQPASPGRSWVQMKSLNHEYTEGEQLFAAANLVFMEVILVVSPWQDSLLSAGSLLSFSCLLLCSNLTTHII